MYFVGKLNREIFRCISEDIRTDEVIITEERIHHVKESHPGEHEKIKEYLKETVENPDYVIADKHPNTGLIIKKIKKEDTYIELVLRVCTSKDELDFKNSIISLWEISERRLRNYLRNKSILYKKT
ncbi:MAG: hypothetical protein J6J44_00505 [Lachnospiraceae bacterium]|nr:hypothetical protein [Lachnospiraceae bacterium]MBP3592985.1 hypothetical protein [Lachnospiraceae bacterium]